MVGRIYCRREREREERKRGKKDKAMFCIIDYFIRVV